MTKKWQCLQKNLSKSNCLMLAVEFTFVTFISYLYIGFIFWLSYFIIIKLSLKTSKGEMVFACVLSNPLIDASFFNSKFKKFLSPPLTFKGVEGIFLDNKPLYLSSYFWYNNINKWSRSKKTKCLLIDHNRICRTRNCLHCARLNLNQ